jgi:hypothetical protein
VSEEFHLVTHEIFNSDNVQVKTGIDFLNSAFEATGSTSVAV